MCPSPERVTFAPAWQLEHLVGSQPLRPSSQLFDLVSLTRRGTDLHWGWLADMAAEALSGGEGQCSTSLEQSHHQAAPRMDQSLQG